MTNIRLKKINTVKLLLVGLVLLLSANTVYANVGKIVYGYGNNYALDGDGNRRDLIKGDVIQEGDTLVTGRGRMHVRLIDGGFVSVYPNSEYRIDKFKFSGGENNKNVTARNNKKNKQANDNFKFKTTVATIGIRGTGFFARLCQSDCFDADGNPLQDGLHVKNNTGIITVKTNAGEVSLAQGQSAFAASSEDHPQQTIQPPITHNQVVPDIELFDFDDKILAVNLDVEVGSEGPAIDPSVTPPVTTPSVVLTKMEYVTSDTITFPASFGGLDTANATDSILQNGDEISNFQGIGVYVNSGVLVFDQNSATLVESGSDTTLGVLWNRWSGGYTFTEDGFNVPQGPQAGNDIHLIGSDNITPNLAGLTGRGTVNYVNVGGTNPTISGAAGNQVGTHTLNVSIDYATAEITIFQLETTFGAAAAATIMRVNMQTTEFLTGTSGNTVSLGGSCTGSGCGLNGGSVNGQASINLVGPNAEGIYGVYNLTNLENAVSGSYLAK